MLLVHTMGKINNNMQSDNSNKCEGYNYCRHA